MPPKSPDAIPHIPVSWGELIDKISILEIKSMRISDPVAIENVLKELSMLQGIARDFVEKDAAVSALKAELYAVNLALWDIEDHIRAKESRQAFDAEFIGLARSVYIQNDLRSALKKQINLALKSELVEEESYKKYS